MFVFDLPLHTQRFSQVIAMQNEVLSNLMRLRRPFMWLEFQMKTQRSWSRVALTPVRIYGAKSTSANFKAQPQGAGYALI